MLHSVSVHLLMARLHKAVRVVGGGEAVSILLLGTQRYPRIELVMVHRTLSWLIWNSSKVHPILRTYGLVPVEWNVAARLSSMFDRPTKLRLTALEHSALNEESRPGKNKAKWLVDRLTVGGLSATLTNCNKEKALRVE